MKVRSFPHLPSSGLSSVGRFVPFFSFSRSSYPPPSVLVHHFTRSLPYVRVVLLCFCLIDLLRSASPESRKKPNLSQLFRRWLFLHSVSLVGTAAPDVFIVLAHYAKRGFGKSGKKPLFWLRYFNYAVSSCLVTAPVAVPRYVCRSSALRSSFIPPLLSVIHCGAWVVLNRHSLNPATEKSPASVNSVGNFRLRGHFLCA